MKRIVTMMTDKGVGVASWGLFLISESIFSKKKNIFL